MMNRSFNKGSFHGKLILANLYTYKEECCIVILKILGVSILFILHMIKYLTYHLIISVFFITILQYHEIKLKNKVNDFGDKMLT